MARSQYKNIFIGLVIGLSVVSATSQPARQGKKVYISVDMEGISGISGSDQLSPGGGEYGRSRKLMAEDANAAIRGAIAAGATEIVVNDSHGGQRNLLPEDLHPAARLISHSFKRYGMMEGLDETFDAAIFIGYHAKASAANGLFAHTGSGVVRDLSINGRSVGEGGMNAMLAAWYGVPVVLVTGDDIAVAEVRETAASARGVAVKRAINVRAVELMPLAAIRTEIETAARDAVARSRKPAPNRRGAYRVQLQFRDTLIPEIAEAIPMFQRPAPDTITYSADTMPAAYRLIRVLYRFINPD
ncbi:MAG TPA: M55 family metallopeptidase [Pyrinomonadaceae bacterium]|nr:M55 family metallopeptidase [Pyrinomonadaceae bacterium]